MYQEISSGSGEHHLTGHKGSAQEKLWEICETLVQKEDQPTMRKFFDLNTVASRMQNTYTIETEYCGMDGVNQGIQNPLLNKLEKIMQRY